MTEPVIPRPRPALGAIIGLAVATLIGLWITLDALASTTTIGQVSDGSSRRYLHRSMVAWTAVAGLATIAVLIGLVLCLARRSRPGLWLGLAGGALIVASWIAVLSFESPDY